MERFLDLDVEWQHWLTFLFLGAKMRFISNGRSVDVHVTHLPRLGKRIAWILHANRKLPKAH
ncbi:hypothetical protein BC2230_120180 [Burkholderia cepacia]